MTVTVKFFASLREQLGCSEVAVDITEPLTAIELWAKVCPDPLPPYAFIAINWQYHRKDDLVHEDDEVAFFPPVTGG